MELWNIIGKKLFPDFRKTDEKFQRLSEKFRQYQTLELQSEERKLKELEALEAILYAPDVIYYKQVPSKQDIYIVRADRNKGTSKKIILYQLHEGIPEEVGFLDFNFTNCDGLKIEFLLIKSGRRQGLGSLLLKEAEVLFPHCAVYGEAVPQPGEKIDLEQLVSFYEKNGYKIDRSSNYPLFYKERPV